MNAIFDPNLYIGTLTIVGLGGTGAQVARIVGRIAYDMARRRQHAPDIVLIDPDKVEEANVGRQLFAPGDIGQYKVEVVGRRLNLALGLAVRWLPEQVDAQRHFEGQHNVVIGCVDNHVGRRELHNVRGVLISAGNHADSGQVCIGNTADESLIWQSMDRHEGRSAYLPKEGLLFPQLLEPEPHEPTAPQPDISCAEMVVQGQQHLLVNGAPVVGR